MTDESIIAYLLQELPEDALEQFEDECFEQEEWPTQIDVVEDELIEAYLRDELTPERRQLFEENYLTTHARQERVAIAAALLRYIDECNATSKTTVAVSPPERSWTGRVQDFWRSLHRALRTATAIAMVALMAGAIWVFFPHTPSPRTIVRLTLAISNNNRAEGVQADKVKLTSNVEAVRISLMLPQRVPPAAHYRIQLENDNGESRSLEIAEKDAQSILVIIPAAQLARGQYALKLFVTRTDGVEERINGSYYFAVE